MSAKDELKGTHALKNKQIEIKCLPEAALHSQKVDNDCYYKMF